MKSSASPHGRARPDRAGILVVSFGTSVPEARRAIDNLVDSAKEAFPEAEVRLAFTSNIIRRKIAREQNVGIPTPAEALARMQDEGITRVCVMPSHIIPGEEYDDIRSVVDAFASIRGKYGFRRIALGSPYLHSVPDCDRMAEILAARFGRRLEDEGTAIVLMGHGTPTHSANAMYCQLQLALDRIADGRFFIGTVEAAPTIEDVVRGLKKHPSVGRLVLSPLMIVSGDHANNDMAGPDDDSWLHRLRREGYEDVEPHLVGLGEDPRMAEVFVERIREMLL